MEDDGCALRSSGLCLLYHPFGRLDPTAAHWWFSLRNNWFLTGYLLSFHRSAHRCWLKPLRQSTDLRSNAGIRLFNLGLNRLIEKSGNSLKRFILHCLCAIRAFHCQAMDFGGECFQLSLFHTSLRWL